MRTDTAELDRLDLLFDKFIQLDVRILLACLEHEDLLIRLLQALFIGDYKPAAERLVLTGLTIDGDANIHVFLETLLGCRSECRFQRTEYHILVDVLLTRKRIDEQQNFAAHCLFPFF